MNTANGFPVYTTVMQANHIIKKDDKLTVASLTEEDIKKIQSLARDENIGDRVIELMSR